MPDEIRNGTAVWLPQHEMARLHARAEQAEADAATAYDAGKAVRPGSSVL